MEHKERNTCKRVRERGRGKDMMEWGNMDKLYRQWRQGMNTRRTRGQKRDTRHKDTHTHINKHTVRDTDDNDTTGT